MFGLMLAAQIFVAGNGEIVVPPWNKTDQEVFELIRQEAERQRRELQHRREMVGQAGCPFEPGTYWNLECV